MSGKQKPYANAAAAPKGQTFMNDMFGPQKRGPGRPKKKSKGGRKAGSGGSARGRGTRWTDQQAQKTRKRLLQAAEEQKATIIVKKPRVSFVPGTVAHHVLVEAVDGWPTASSEGQSSRAYMAQYASRGLNRTTLGPYSEPHSVNTPLLFT